MVAEPNPAVLDAAFRELSADEETFPSVEVSEFLGWELPPRQWIFRDLLQARDAAMLHAWRGTGKSHFLIGLGVAAACGEPFLKWHPTRAHSVLYVDGEMPREDLHARFRAELAGRKPLMSLRLVADDLLESGIPSLATEAGQALIDDEIARTGCELLILDSLATLFRTDSDANTSEFWQPMQSWLLRLRRAGRTVLFSHHDGKGFQQRGTSSKEDILSTVIQLRNPDDYHPSEGARFRVEFRKARSLFGEAARPFEVQLTEDEDGRRVWTHTAHDRRTQRILDLVEEGLSQRAIAEEVGIGVATVNRTLQRVKAKR